jgi:DNA-binding response OmpR family regulator
MSILLIEDDPEALAIFAQILQKNGFEVHTAATAEAGLQQLEAQVAQAIILDLHLPALDGLGCLRAVRGRHLAHIPVTIITGDYFLDEELLSQIEALDAHLYLKPVWEEDLLKIVQDMSAKNGQPTHQHA